MTARSRHKFRPDPLHPTECAYCGRRKEAHDAPAEESLAEWQRRLTVCEVRGCGQPLVTRGYGTCREHTDEIMRLIGVHVVGVS